MAHIVHLDPLSPLLFDIFVDPLLRTLQKQNLAYKFIHGNDEYKGQLMYADDFVIICDSPSKLQKAINICKKVCDSYNMKANVIKSATMVFNRKYCKPENTYWDEDEKNNKNQKIQLAWDMRNLDKRKYM